MLFLTAMLGLMFVFVGIFVAGAGDSNNNAWQFLLGSGLGVAAAAVFFTCLVFFVKHDNHHQHQKHMAAYHQLRSDGWNIQSHDVHINIDKVDIHCLRFSLKQFNHHYRVVVKRDKDIGGGYTFIQPQDNPMLLAICTNQQTDNYVARKEATRESVRG